MLVLTRKSKQKIHIGNQIVITVLKVYGDQVSIGIEAPEDMQIFREELVKESAKEVNFSLDDAKQDPTKGRHHLNSKWRIHKQPQTESVEEV